VAGVSATAQDDLIAAYSQACAMLKWLDAAGPPPAGPVKMTYSDGVRTYDYTAFRAALIQQIKDLPAMIQQAGGPFETVSVSRG
jgi:hypothetical protein